MCLVLISYETIRALLLFFFLKQAKFNLKEFVR